MSFLAIFNCDGTPIDSEVIGGWYEDISINLKLLGPTHQAAMLWSVPDATSERTGACHAVELAGRYRLLGRIRLDRRDDLRMLLAMPETEPDAVLCLRAYGRWGERCVEHLRGDFCFVVWDEIEQKLFCARDQLGVRPLFYGSTKTSWVVSDSLDLVALHSGLTEDLDDFWVADFLTMPFCLDFDRTVYKHLKRLAPAHALMVSRDGSMIKRYWSLALDEPIFYRRRSQYIDHFHAVLARAIKDRLPDGRVGISMSGGLDSTTIAAKAFEVTGDASRIIAFTGYFERLIPDEEPYFSALVAKRLKISHTLFALDDAYDFQTEDPTLRTQEPGGPSAHKSARQIIENEMASRATVWFYGEGPDNALTFEWKSYLWWLAARGDWMHFSDAVVQYVHGKQAREWLMTIRKSTSLRRQPVATVHADFPEWVEKDLVERLDLAGRARDSSKVLRGNKRWRPQAMASFESPIWQMYFENLDPVISGTSLDFRHPYVDLDVLTFMLRTPPIPWARHKRLIREAMRGALPDEVLARNKAPLVVDPLTKVPKAPLSPPSNNQTLRRFVDPAKFPDGSDATSKDARLAKIRMLDVWLKGRTK